MRRSLPFTLVLGGLLSLLVAAPASAAISGTFCGQVTAFLAPTAVADGSITIDGVDEVIDNTDLAVIDAATLTILSAVAAADATTCVEITANGDNDIVDITIAAQAEICGTASLDTVTGIYSVAGVALPLGVVNADAELEALLDAAAAADANICIDVTISGTSGLVTTVSLNATLTLCGEVTLDADSATIGGVDVPLSLLDAEAKSVLLIAVDAGADVCVAVVVDDTALVQANLAASIELCGTVSLDADGNAAVDGVVIDADLLDASAAALLELAATADGTACAAVDANSTGGNTTVSVTVSIDVCAEVTAMTDDTITLGDVTFVFAGAADAGIEIGDEMCVTATTSPIGGPVITDADTTDAGGGPGVGGGGPTLPDTAMSGAPHTSPVPLGGALLLIVAMALVTLRLVNLRSR